MSSVPVALISSEVTMAAMMSSVVDIIEGFLVSCANTGGSKDGWGERTCPDCAAGTGDVSCWGCKQC
jgi:hypothetical protein